MSSARLSRTLPVVVSLFVLFLVYLAAAWVLGRQLPSQASVAGVHVGGLDVDGAKARLSGRLESVDQTPLTVRLGPERRNLVPRDAGLGLDLDATLRGATGFSLDPRDVWFRLTGGGEYPLRPAVDVTGLSAAVSQIAGQVDRPVTQGAVTFPGGEVEVVRSRAGLAVDVPGTVEAIAREWPGSHDIEGAVTVTEPDVDPGVLDRYVEEVADVAVSAPLVLVVGRTRAEVEPADFAPVLRTTAEGGQAVLGAEPQAVRDLVKKEFPRAERAPVDATLDLSGARVVVLPETAGQSIDLDGAVAAVTTAVAKDSARVAPIPMRAAPPARTQAEVAAWGVDQTLAVVDLPRPADPAHLPNVAQALTAIDGAVVAPGESFRLTERVGDVTAERGYTDAPTADLSGRAVGGGVGYVSSALYEAALRGGMAVGPHTPHRHAVSWIGDGLDATLSGDVTFTNDGSSGVFVSATTVGGISRVSIWGKRTGEVSVTSGPRTSVVTAQPVLDGSAACRPDPGMPGFGVGVQRVINAAGATVRSENYEVTYEPRAPRHCAQADPDAAPTDLQPLPVTPATG